MPVPPDTPDPHRDDPPSTAAERSVARALAVAPGPCRLGYVERMTGLPGPEVADVVATLTARGLVTDDGSGLTVGTALRDRLLRGLPRSLLGDLHRQAARLCADTDPGRAAAHLLQAVRATGEADPELVDQLATAGPVDPSTGADLLCAALARADAGNRSRWLLAAADLLVLAGRSTEALHLLSAELAADRAGGAERALLLGRLGAVHAAYRPSVALDQLRRARTGHPVGPDQRGWLLAVEASIACLVGHPDADGLLREAGRAQARHPSPLAGARLAVARATRAMSLGAVHTARDLLAVDPSRPAVRGEAAAVRAERIAVQLALGAYEDAATALEAAYDDLPAAAGPVLAALSCLRMLGVGELQEADAQARLALDRPAGPVTGEVRSALLAVRAEVAYRLGRPEAARALIEGTYRDPPWPDSVPYAPLRLVAAADPDPLRHRALIRSAAADVTRSARPVLLVAQHGPRLVQALLLLGDVRRANAVAGQLARVAERTPVPLWRGAAGHADALVRRDPAALRAAVRALRATGARPALADALLDLSRSPRVRVAEARTAGQEAAALYGRMGAVGDQERAERWAHRLDRTRRRPAPRPLGCGLDALTAREAGIAELLAAGATKQQVAGRLYLSFHTVDTHLRAIYAKLGIRSRLQLARLWDGRPRPTGTEPGPTVPARLSGPPDASPSAAPRSSRGAG
ncbi:helix-turn-helix transcriptional regulator [Micromonospora yasonensis]|uniref:helix-turn-helix domain-containing protein n=1 Tax=Micromonospora yasonensis TaxID=1128667 RepID=UPI002230D567|nr:helix-turn-helix transcriptional regulator [Micromonospora yasonensis]MCW3840909.1 helix-turn-helix transcriptional regulator [Micromonospora yasonensis]